MINIGSDIASSMSKNSNPDDPLCFHRPSQLKNTDHISRCSLFLSLERFLHTFKDFYC